MSIREFRGRYFFLSNFFPVTFVYQGLTFKNAKAAFQAAKCPERIKEFCDLGPNQAKHLGRKIRLRPDWDDVRQDVMYQVCLAKFTQNPDLLGWLLATGEAELVEGNTWGDTFWGVYNGVGENNLGKTLMRLRNDLKRKG